MLVVKNDILESYIIPGRLPLTALTCIGSVTNSLTFTGYPKRWVRFDTQLAALMFINKFALSYAEYGAPISIKDMLFKTKELIDLFQIKVETDFVKDFNPSLSFEEVERLIK